MYRELRGRCTQKENRSVGYSIGCIVDRKTKGKKAMSDCMCF